GFSVEGQENIQEILSEQLYLCQFLTALSILRPGGHFACKLFDVFTPFSVGLVYLMYRTFNQISIHKPVTSRPANFERYIICKGLREDFRDFVRAYMYEINVLQNKCNANSEDNDVQSIVPMHIVKGNENFYEYIRDSNNHLGEHQIRNLRKIHAFVSNATLRDNRQNEVRLKCLQLCMFDEGSDEDLSEHLPYRRPRFRMQSLIDEYGVLPPRKSPVRRLRDYAKKYWHNLNSADVANSFLESIPLIRCLKEYKIRKYLIGDILAGITVAIMHIPQGIAYGVLAGLSASNGLYVSFFPVIIYMIFGTCPHLSIGTFAIVSLLTAKAINGVSLPSLNSTTNESIIEANFSYISNVSSDALLINEKVGIATTLAFFVGVIQLILWLFRLGFITTYMTEPFISGLNVGAAVQVFSSQIPAAFGVPNPSDIQGFLKLPKFYVRVIGSIFKSINWISTAIAFTSIIILLVVKALNDRYKKKIRITIPTELVLVIFGTLISYLAKLHDQHGVTIVGTVKRGLPAPTAPAFTNVSSLLLPAITITIVSLCLNISVAKMFARKYDYKVRSNQELLAYGLGNVVSSFFQCYPSSGSLSRSMVQGESGGTTSLIGGFSSVILAVVILALAPLLESLPMACLAGIIIVNLKGLLLKVSDFMYYYRINIMEAILWLVTFLTVILSDVDIGVYVGIAISFLMNTIRTQRPRFVVLGRVGDTAFYKSIKVFPSAEQHVNIKVLRFDGSLYACNAPFFKRKFYELIDIRLGQRPLISFRIPETVEIQDSADKYVVLDCSPMNFVDSVGVKLLIEIYKDMKKRNIHLYLSECRYDVRYTLDSMKFYEHTDGCIIYVSTSDAVIAILAEIQNKSTVETISQAVITQF
ncbi:unnamed protein product, partial [Rotaria magnacalcarata]